MSTSVRKLNANHFFFMRSVVQGLDLRASWDRCLAVDGESTDLRRVKSTITWIRDEFAAAARREHKSGTARLVLIDAQSVSAGPVLPSLEQFAAERGMEDFSFREQQEAYAEAFGPGTHRNARKGRLIDRQLKALRWLEQLLAQEPGPNDGVEAWFAPHLADRLKSAGLSTLAELAGRINGVGARWWKAVPGVGALKASRILDWLRQHQASTGLAIGGHVALKRSELQPAHLNGVVAPATAVVPLEKFVVPAYLDGSRGVYRAPAAQCLIGARDDYAAIAAWLDTKRDPNGTGKTATHRAYRKEAERLLLWAILERHKPLSSLTVEDVNAFKAFLASPPAGWCGPRHRQRWSPLWRPLEGPLSPLAIRQALVILRSLGTFLVSQNYLIGNPFAGVSLPRGEGRTLGSSRTLTIAQWDLIESELDAQAVGAPGRRLALAMRWLYATGLRLSEMCAARCGDLERVSYRDPSGKDAVGYLLTVEGKGDKVRQVPVPAHLIEALQLELEVRGRDRDAAAPSNDEVPILASFSDGSKGEALSTSGLAKLVKEFLSTCASKAAGHDAEQLRRASTHWMRHTHGSHAVNGRPGREPVPVQIVQNNLGHTSLATTSGYLTTERDARLAAMQGFGKRS